jgi:SNF2 family DNA or RNA helicase
VDESHGIKNPNSKRFAALKMMNELPVKAKACLTGTPIANTLFDLWSQLEFAGKGLSGFMTYKNFRRFHGKFEKREGSPIEKLTGIAGIPLIQERLARMSFLLSKKESGMQLPERVEEIWEVEMTPKQLAMYNKVASEMVVEIEEMLDRASEEGTSTIVAENILTKLLRLAQVCSGHVTVELSDGGRRIMQVDDKNPKADELINILKEDAEQDSKSKAIVWCIWDEDERIISERLHKAGIKHVGYNHSIRPEYRVKSAYDAELEYNRNHDCMVFVGKPQSGGTGLDLVGYDKDNPESSDRYTGRVINYSCNWSSVDRRQSEERPFSRGARSRISITELMVSGTMDEEIRERVKGKVAMANNIQNIRTILESLKGSL